MIKKCTSYKIGDFTFNNLQQLEKHIDNNLGMVVDIMCNDGIFSPKHRIIIFDYLKCNKEILKGIFYDYDELEDLKNREED